MSTQRTDRSWIHANHLRNGITGLRLMRVSSTWTRTGYGDGFYADPTHLLHDPAKFVA